MVDGSMNWTLILQSNDYNVLGMISHSRELKNPHFFGGTIPTLLKQIGVHMICWSKIGMKAAKI